MGDTKMYSSVGAFSAFGILSFSTLTLVLLSGSVTTVDAAPAKFDSSETPFPLNFQPPLVDGADDRGTTFKSLPTAIDSYGNPIDALKPIDTPDGRKVISAQGLQFEIPNYASGITEIKKPSDDLLPPFVGELKKRLKGNNNNVKNNNGSSSQQNDVLNNRTIATTTAAAEMQNSSESSDNANYNNNNKNNESISRAFEENYLSDLLLSIVNNLDKPINDDNPNDNDNDYVYNDYDDDYDDDIDIDYINNNLTNTNHHTTNNINEHNEFTESERPSVTTQALEPKFTTDSSIDHNHSKPNNSKSPALTLDSNSVPTSSTTIQYTTPPSVSSTAYTSTSSPTLSNTTASLSLPNVTASIASPTKTHSNSIPLSNGNFNYPNIPTDLDTINRIASKYQNPLPTLDPIAVAEYTTTVDVESAEVVELKPNSLPEQQEEESNDTPIVENAANEIPDYLKELNDPDIAGPVPYDPEANAGSLNVLAWDLLPPVDSEPEIVTKEDHGKKKVTSTKAPTTTHRVAHTKPPKVKDQDKDNEADSQKSTAEDSAPASSETSNTRHRNYNTYTTTTVDKDGTPEKVVVTVATKDASSNSQEDQDASQEKDVRPVKRPITSSRRRGSTYFTTSTHEPHSTTTRAPRSTTHRTNRRPHRNRTTSTPTSTTSTTTTTPSPTATKSTTSTTSTTTTTTTTTTTRKPKTKTTIPPRSTTTLDPSTFYKLENGDSYTLPSWLADIDDPDLDVAVQYVIPDDLDKYDVTIAGDILPPLEPFEDLNDLSVPPPPESKTTTTTTTTTTAAPRTTRPSRRTTTDRWTRTRPPRPSTTPIPSDKTTEKPSFNFLSTTITSDIFDALDPDTSSTTYNIITDTLSSTNTPAHNELDQEHDVEDRQDDQQSSTESQHENETHNFQATNEISSVTTVDAPQLETETAEGPVYEDNPFLQNRNVAGGDDYAQKPYQFSPNAAKFTTAATTTTTTSTTPPTTTTTTTTTTSTTTTTTTTPAPLEANPFDSATIPAWLQDFDYAEIGPGVPFIYDPEDPKNAVFNDLLPPSQEDSAQQQDIESTKVTPAFVATSPTASSTSSSSSQNSPQSFSTLSSISPTNPSSIASEHSSNNYNNNNNNNEYNSNKNNFNPNVDPISDYATLTPPLVLVPPVATEDPSTDSQAPSDSNAQNGSPTFNQNFAAPFNTDASVSSKKETLPATVPIKTTFSKSEEGKVITNNIFLNSAAGSTQPTPKPFGFIVGINAQDKATPTTAFGASFSPVASGFTKAPNSFAPVTSSAAASGPGGRYTGGFGGAPGVLGHGKIGYAVQPDGSIIDPDHTYRTPVDGGADVSTPNKAASAAPAPVPVASAPQPSFANRASIPDDSPAADTKYRGRFGGPPGVLSPYDNAKA